GSDTVDVQKRIFDLMASGDPAQLDEAEELYRRLLPLVVFCMQSLENFLCYGKMLAAARHGISGTVPRTPGIAPNAFGIASMRQAVRAIYPELDPAVIG